MVFSARLALDAVPLTLESLDGDSSHHGMLRLALDAVPPVAPIRPAPYVASWPERCAIPARALRSSSLSPTTHHTHECNASRAPLAGAHARPHCIPSAVRPHDRTAATHARLALPHIGQAPIIEAGLPLASLSLARNIVDLVASCVHMITTQSYSLPAPSPRRATGATGGTDGGALRGRGPMAFNSRLSSAARVDVDVGAVGVLRAEGRAVIHLLVGDELRAARA